MTGSRLSWLRPTIDLHLLKPFNLLSNPTNPTPTNLDHISINHHQIQSPNLISLPNLIQTLTSLLQFKKLPPPRPTSFRHDSGCAVSLFRPYVAKVPWHGGVRAFLSQLFPRYGHYCGPNWYSGKDRGSMLWDPRPIDWLDFCCYCHDIEYDTHDQAKLLKADLAFLECLILDDERGSREQLSVDGLVWVQDSANFGLEKFYLSTQLCSVSPYFSKVFPHSSDISPE